jgi:hypothetical protein
VRVRVEKADQRCLISVIDQGIGMIDADLAATNERLSGHGASEISLTNRIGFFVIGRLARRVGVAVRLGRSSGGGVIAQVALPPALVTTSRDEASGATAGTAEPADPLGDSPQSARERLLGALRTVEPGASVAPAPPSSRLATGVPSAPAGAGAPRATQAIDAFLPSAADVGWGREGRPCAQGRKGRAHRVLQGDHRRGRFRAGGGGRRDRAPAFSTRLLGVRG